MDGIVSEAIRTNNDADGLAGRIKRVPSTEYRVPSTEYREKKNHCDKNGKKSIAKARTILVDTQDATRYSVPSTRYWVSVVLPE